MTENTCEQTTTWDRECVICASKWRTDIEGDDCLKCRNGIAPQTTEQRLARIREIRQTQEISLREAQVIVKKEELRDTVNRAKSVEELRSVLLFLIETVR